MTARLVEKLKIAIFTHTFPPEFGAAPSRLADMAKGLSKAGYEVEVFTGMPNYPQGKIYSEYNYKSFKKENTEYFKIHRHWIFPIKSNRKIHRLINMLSIALSVFKSLPYLLKLKPDLYIIQYPPIVLPIVVWFFSKLTKSLLFVNVSDLWPSAIIDLGKMERGAVYNFLLRLEKFIYSKADYCLAQSEEISHYIRNVGQKNVLLYRTGADVKLFKPNEKKSIEENTRRLKILYVGVLGLAHNLYELIRKVDFEGLEVELHIYGDGFEKANIEEYIQQNLLKYIFLHKPISQIEVAELVGHFDISLVCQKSYVKGTLPSKLYEAMASGKPVLFHGAGEGATIVKETDCGLVSEPSNFKKLEENIILLKNETKETLKKIGLRGRKKAVEEFDRNLQIQKLVTLIGKFERLEAQNSKLKTQK